MGKKRDKERTGAKKINVEIAPGNQAAMDRYMDAYNRRPDRTTPKIKYTDVVNMALDRLLSARRPAPKSPLKAGKKQK
jgi:hypothetical protein